MSLERKLFLSFSILILCIILPLYFFSDFLIHEDLEHTKKQIIFVVALFALVSLAIAWWIVRGFTKPIKQLSQMAEKVAAGKYHEALNPALTKRNDEVGTLAKSFDTMVQGLLEREKIRSVLNKVVSKDIADEILKTNIHLGGEERKLTIQFCDIRNFTAMTEHFSPQETIALLNLFMTKMTRIIEGEGGIIDKYIGDEIMALYGAPIPHPDHALRALSSAKIMIETLKKWNEEKAHKERIEMGIGIHTGVVVAGNMGAEDRLNYTVVGTGVNLTARLCAAARPGQILISEYTLNEPRIKESFVTNPLPPIVAKGFSQPIQVYEIVGFKW